MPVEAGQLNWRVIALGERSEQGSEQHGAKDALANDHVKGVQPGHQEIEDEKHLHVRRIGTRVMEHNAGQLLIVVVKVIFGELDAEKYQANENRQYEKESEPAVFA